MDLKTNLSVGDEIHFIEGRKAHQSTVRKIAIDVKEDKSIVITYICNSKQDEFVGIKVTEGDGFKTKAELLKSL